jgi:hypothetical protein
VDRLLRPHTQVLVGTGKTLNPDPDDARLTPLSYNVSLEYPSKPLSNTPFIPLHRNPKRYS